MGRCSRWLLIIAVILLVSGPVLAEGYRTSVGSGADEVPVVVVKGTPYDMGYALGRLTKDDAVAMLQGFLGKSQGSGSPRYTNEMLDAAWQAVSPYVHERFKEEMRGLADGAGLPLEQVRRAHMVPVVSDYSCSGIAAWGKATKDGHLYQTRNLDWEMNVGAQDHPLLVVYLPNEGVPHVNVTFAGYIGVNTGMSAEGIALSEMGNSPGRDYPFDLNGAHFTTLFRDVLYDAHNLDEAVGIITKARRIKKYHFVVGDGKTGRAVKMLAHAPNLVVWKDNDPRDEYAPRVLENVVYEDEGRGAFHPLREKWGALDEHAMIDICRLIPIKGSNVLSVVYDATALELWVAYAEKQIEAYQRPYVPFRLKDYLQYNAQGAQVVADAKGTTGRRFSAPGFAVLGGLVVLTVGIPVWLLRK